MWVLRWQGIVDFLVVSAAVYLLLIWGQQARALRIAFGIVCLRAAALLAQQLDLVLTAWVFDATSVIAFILLLVIFQPELRHALLQLDFGLRRRGTSLDPSMPALVSICDAAFALAQSGRGALLVIVGRDPVDSLVTGGVPLGGSVSREILEAIFRKVSPVHDGATIIEGERISRVGVILPLTESENIPAEYGTRHRAALGLAERCDAAVIVVSEERGTVTLVHDHQHTQQKHVEDLVHNLGSLSLAPRSTARKDRRNIWLKAAALGFAALIWFISFGVTGATVRNISVPVEFTNVPGGLHISRQSASALQVQLRGTSWLFEAVSLTKMAARVDLRGAKEGKLTVPFRPESISPPPGIRVERVSPDSVTLVLSRH
jgi:diadenylate cyclase